MPYGSEKAKLFSKRYDVLGKKIVAGRRNTNANAEQEHLRTKE